MFQTGGYPNSMTNSDSNKTRKTLLRTRRIPKTRKTTMPINEQKKKKRKKKRNPQTLS